MAPDILESVGSGPGAHAGGPVPSSGSVAGRYTRAVLFCFLAGGSVLLQTVPGAATLTPDDVAQEAEAAFRSAMEAWAYDAYWRLWDMGSTASRAAMSQGDFTDRMRAGTTRPAAGKQVEAIQVVPSSPDTAVAYVRFGLEEARGSLEETTDRSFLLRLEDGRWTVNLWDFVGLAYYFPPIYLPERPLFIPPPRPPRPKGPTR